MPHQSKELLGAVLLVGWLYLSRDVLLIVNLVVIFVRSKGNDFKVIYLN